jgi:hypothetical protein
MDKNSLGSSGLTSSRSSRSSILTSSLIGASTAELATLPISALKTVYQSRSLSIKDSFNFIYNSNGIKGFYKASFPAVSYQVLSSTYRLTVFNYLTDAKFNLFLIGIFSSITCNILTHPIDYIRIRLQNNSNIQLRKIYTGITPNIAKAVLGGVTYLPIRESLKRRFPETKSWKIGLTTAVVSTIIVHPFDYLKTYMIGRSTIGSLAFRNPYKGLSLNLARIVPHFVIMTEVADRLR